MIDLERQIHDLVESSFQEVPTTSAVDVVDGRRPVRFSASRRWPVAVAAALVLALVAVIAVIEIDDPEHSYRLGTSPRPNRVATNTDPVPSALGEWTIDLGGEIPYAPVVVDGAIIVVSANADFTQTQIIALQEDVDTASRLWSVDLGSPVISNPVASTGTILLRLADDRLVALDATDGSVRWSAETGTNIKGPPPPVVAKGTVFTGSQDGRVQAHELGSGAELWSRQLKEAVLAAPRASGSDLYLSTGELPLGPKSRGAVYALDAQSGAVRWRQRTRAPVVTTAAVGGAGVAVTTTVFGRGDPSTLVRIWGKGSDATSSAVLAGTAPAPVYGSRGEWVVAQSNGFVEPYDRLTLRATKRWSVLVGADQQQPSLIAAGGRLVAAGSDLVGIDGLTGNAQWRVRFPDAFFGESDDPDRIVAVSRGGSLAVVDVRDGSLVVDFALHDTPSGAVLHDGTLVWTGSGGVVTTARVA